MISGEKDISGDLTLLGVEGFDSGSENSLSEEDTKCTGSWAKDGADGCTFPVGAGNTDNSRTADLGWKPKHMRSWSGCKWGVGTGTTGMLTAGRGISAKICAFPKWTGDITGDRGSTRVL